MAALDGLRILDLTQYEAGPSATQALAWLGADVVKVERPGEGEPGRGGAALAGSGYFVNWNSNKRSLALDVGTAEGRDVFLRLVPRFDVVVENFGPGVVERLRLVDEHVRAVHPTVIYASVKGFGLDGPYADYKCFDGIAMAMAGAFSVTGARDGRPLPPGPTMGDVGTGMQLALAICAAYVQKLRTGVGQRIEVSMQEAMTYYMRSRIGLGSDYGRKAAPRMDSGRGALVNLYPCDPFGPNDFIYVMAVTDGMWRALCRATGLTDFADDERFSTDAARARNSEVLRAAIEAWTRQHSKHEAMRMLAGAGVPCGAVLDTRELHEDPHLLARGFVHEIDHPDHGKVKILGWAPRMSESRVPIVPAAPLGAHTDDVLLEELGIDADALEGLRTRGVIA